jgi:hypothetical protein
MINTTKIEARILLTPLHKKIILHQQVQRAERNSVVKINLCISQKIGCTIKTEYKTNHNNMALRKVQEARREDGKEWLLAAQKKNSPKQWASPFLYISLSSLKKVPNFCKNTSKIK